MWFYRLLEFDSLGLGLLELGWFVGFAVRRRLEMLPPAATAAPNTAWARIYFDVFC